MACDQGFFFLIFQFLFLSLVDPNCPKGLNPLPIVISEDTITSIVKNAFLDYPENEPYPGMRSIEQDWTPQVLKEKNENKEKNKRI